MAEKMKVDSGVGGVEGSSLGEVIDHGTNGVVPDVDCPSDSNEYGLDGDLCVEAEACTFPPLILPPSTGNVGDPDECVADLLSVYSFLSSFSVSFGIGLLDYHSPFLDFEVLSDLTVDLRCLISGARMKTASKQAILWLTTKFLLFCFRIAIPHLFEKVFMGGHYNRLLF
ncbi:hypothetical protein AgCh_016772 [Apium graveolens]